MKILDRQKICRTEKIPVRRKQVSHVSAMENISQSSKN